MQTIKKAVQDIKEDVKHKMAESSLPREQVTSKPGTILTTLTGCPFAHNKNSLTAGPHGPVMLQDTILLEKLTQFTREKTPPRNVHALGAGAYGTFTVTGDISNYTMAKVFQPGKKTELFARLSGTFTEQGDAETIRDLRGFAMKFYTEDGNWDLLCINTPVFNCRDGKVGPDAVHASKRDPRTGGWNPVQFWDFGLNHPEALHFVSMLYTDRIGTPVSFRHMHAYGCNTYSLINVQKQRFWVKFHLISTLGAKGFTQDQAKLMAGEDPNFLTRDLHEAIAAGQNPKWKFCVQIMPEEEGYRNPVAFDCTKVWSHKDYPLIEVGIIELNQNPVDHFSEVEQVCFSPATSIPGIGFSPDKLLQARLLIYDDAQHHRIGPNHKLVPVNFAKNAKNINVLHNAGGNFQTNMRTKWPHYYPSNYANNQVDSSLIEPPLKVDGDVGYYDYPLEGTEEDIYGQTRAFWNILDTTQRSNMCANIATSIFKLPTDLAKQVIGQFSTMNVECGKMIEDFYKGKKEGKIPMTQAEALLQCDKTMGRR